MPLSRDPEAREAQIGNLRPAPPAPPGNERAQRSGWRKRQPDPALVDAAINELERDPLLIRKRLRAYLVDATQAEHLEAYLRKVGWTNRKGVPRPEVEHLRRVYDRLIRRAEALDRVVRGVSDGDDNPDLARLWSAATAALEAGAEEGPA